MDALQERIAQYRKMAHDDPDNELGHFRLGKELMEAGQFEEAAQSYRRTLELSPSFSKVFHLLGECLVKLNRRDEAVRVLRQGFDVAEDRGDTKPRDDMAKLLVELGQPAPESKKARTPAAVGAGDGFQCRRPGCGAGPRARRLPAPPIPDELGKTIHQTICAECWEVWLKNLSIKVINEMRLDLSTEKGQEAYDKIMLEFLGME